MSVTFCFAVCKPCGCLVEVCTPRALADSMRKKWFRDKMRAGEVKTLATREEYLALPWECDVCKPTAKAVASNRA